MPVEPSDNPLPALLDAIPPEDSLDLPPCSRSWCMLHRMPGCHGSWQRPCWMRWHLPRQRVQGHPLVARGQQKLQR